MTAIRGIFQAYVKLAMVIIAGFAMGLSGCSQTSVEGPEAGLPPVTATPAPPSDAPIASPQIADVPPPAPRAVPTAPVTAPPADAASTSPSPSPALSPASTIDTSVTKPSAAAVLASSGAPSSTELYTRIARGANLCWFGVKGPLKQAYKFHATAEPQSEGGRAEIIIHERRNAPVLDPQGNASLDKLRLIKVFEIEIAPTGIDPPFTATNAKLPEALASAMSSDVRRWASDQIECSEATAIAAAPPPAPAPAVAQKTEKTKKPAKTAAAAKDKTKVTPATTSALKPKPAPAPPKP